MKKSIITLAITIFIAGTALLICQSSAFTVGNTQDKTTVSKQELYQALKDSLQQFNKESDEKINNYEMSIGEYRSKIANEKKYNKARYEKKLIELDQ